MRKLNRSYFLLFLFLLLLFVLAMIDYWATTMGQNDVDESQGRYLHYTTYLLVLYCIYVIIQAKSRYNGIHFLCLLWFLLMPLSVYINHGSFANYFQTLMWPILFEASWIFTNSRKKNVNSLQFFFYFVFVYGLFIFIFTERTKEGQTNTVYFSLLTLPWFLFEKNRRFQMIILIVFSSIAILSLKRSTLLVMAVSWLVYLIAIVKRKRIGRYFTIILLFTPVFIYTLEFANSKMGGALEERVTKEETDEGRNRLAIYETTIAMIYASSPTELLTGHGHGAVFRDSPLEISAHNDFLEVIYDYGIIIFVLYLCLCISLIKRCIRLYRINSDMFMPYGVSVIIFVVMSSVSHLILYTSYFNYLVLFWGSSEALMSNSKCKIAK